MTQPNEQLTETIEKALTNITEIRTESEYRGWLHALLEENKQLREDLAEERYSFGALEHANIDNLMELKQVEAQLQQTREELSSTITELLETEKSLITAREQAWKAREELEQVKAERDEQKEFARNLYAGRELMHDELRRVENERDKALSELSAKDKVLEWYADEESYMYQVESDEVTINTLGYFDYGNQARSILSQYRSNPND